MMTSSWFVSEISSDKKNKKKRDKTQHAALCSAIVHTHDFSGAITKMLDEIAQDGKVIECVFLAQTMCSIVCVGGERRFLREPTRFDKRWDVFPRYCVCQLVFFHVFHELSMSNKFAINVKSTSRTPYECQEVRLECRN